LEREHPVPATPRLTSVFAKISSRALVPAYLILALGLATTGLATWLTTRDVVEAGSVEFESLTDRIARNFAEALRAYEQMLRGGAGLFRAVPSVDREQWRVYVASLALEKDFPGIQGVGFTKVLRREDIAAHVAAQRAAGLTEYSFSPEGDRETYTAITFLEPMEWRNKRALGFDMFSEPTRRRAMERARDTGEAALTDKVTLVQEADDDIQAGFLMYLPVYRGGRDPGDVATRRAALVGYVYSPFRMGDFVRRTLQARGLEFAQRVRIEVFDGTVMDEEDRLFDSGSADDRTPAYTRTRSLPLEGTTWSFRFSSLPAFEAGLETWRPWAVLLVGSAFSALAGVIAAVIGLQRERALRAEEQARVLVRELSHRVKNTLSIVTAIASQTVRHSSSLQQFDRAFRERLNGLSNVHDLLSSGSTNETSLQKLVGEVLKPYRNTAAANLVVRGRDCLLPSNAAVMLSIILNELATNATKYGAWSTPSGRVTLQWQLVSGEGGRLLKLWWTETGGPPVLAAPKHEGFGTSVMKFAVERSLGGSASAEWRREGAVYRIELPYDAAARPSDEEPAERARAAS
jgi:CHASE1-domain containing sensor protein/two-component sensor histidine kinase